jgi:hypothetical protein
MQAGGMMIRGRSGDGNVFATSPPVLVCGTAVTAAAIYKERSHIELLFK